MVNDGLAFNNSTIFSWVVSWVVFNFSWVVPEKPVLSKGITTFVKLTVKIYASSPYVVVTLGTP